MEGAVTLFQRYSNCGFPMVDGGHGEAHCMPNLGMSLNPTNVGFIEKLTTLLKEKELLSTTSRLGTSVFKLA
jgi:hypothetical protein